MIVEVSHSGKSNTVKVSASKPGIVTVLQNQPINVEVQLFRDGKNGRDGIYLLEKQAGEAIPSYMPVAIIDNFAYRLNNLDPLHQFAFVGFSTTGSLQGEICKIQQIGEIELVGWGLTPNKQYLAGENGQLALNNNNLGFTKVIGYATTQNMLQIIKDYSTILKN